jgi:outer membrane protein assembly factor BamB
VGIPLPVAVDRRAVDDGFRTHLLSGDPDGNVLALDSRSGELLWRYQMGAPLHGTSPTTYMVDGRQYVLVPAGTTLTAWALP